MDLPAATSTSTLSEHQQRFNQVRLFIEVVLVNQRKCQVDEFDIVVGNQPLPWFFVASMLNLYQFQASIC
jgi:hypothetical protein